MKIRTAIALLACIFPLSTIALAQTTAFNFQGRLNDGSTPANGSYDLQFKLFNSVTGGSQVGSTVDRPGLILINGVFSTTLDFGPDAFVGGNRFLEISVKPAGSPNAHVILGARQQILSVPTAVRAATAAHANNADNASTSADSQALGGVAAANYARLGVLNPAGIRFSGNVGVGTDTPNTRLTLAGGPLWTSNQWAASMNMPNGSALGWEANGSGQRFGVGQTNGGLFFFRTTSGFGSTLTPANVDLQITDNGDIAQPLDRNGALKAMAAITAGGVIARCYDGVSGSSTGNCGITVTLLTPGVFYVNFPFQISNRFWLVTVDASGPGAGVLTASVLPHGGVNSRLIVLTKLDASPEYQAFHLFVF